MGTYNPVEGRRENRALIDSLELEVGTEGVGRKANYTILRSWRKV